MSFNPKILAAIIAAGVAGIVLIIFLAGPKNASPDASVYITAEGTEYTVVPLNEDRTINVPGPLGKTTVEIKGGRVRVLDSPCPNKTCVSQGWIERPGETIICLPNRVSITVK